MRTLVKVLMLGLIAMLLAGCLVSLPGVGGSTPPPPGGGALAEHVAGEVLVRPLGDVDVDLIAEAVGGSVIRVLDGLVRIKLLAGADLTATITALEQRADVAYAEPVYIYRTPVVGTARTVTTRAVDYYASQWGPKRIGTEGVWIQSPACSAITVGVVDTGIDKDNTEFGLVVAGKAERILEGSNFVAGEVSTDYDDDDGHGTHVAGIIGAAHDLSGIMGMAGDVKFVAAKVLGPNGGTNEEVAAGIRWAADRAQVINLSLGGWGRSQAIQDAIDYALSRDVIVVAAMGNGYRNTTSHYPGAGEGAIAVGASNPDGTKADFSSEGPHISIAAPGVEIISSIPGPSYATWDGTSMATPHVTGLVALLLSQDGTRKPTMIRTLLEHYATGTGWNKSLGWGVIDALAAYNNADAGSLTDIYGRLQVTVTSGGAVANAEVLIRRASDNTTVTANRTNGDGMAYFHYLRAGNYKVYVTKVTASGTLSGSNQSVSISGGTTGTVTIPIS